MKEKELLVFKLGCNEYGVVATTVKGIISERARNSKLINMDEQDTSNFGQMVFTYG